MNPSASKPLLTALLASLVFAAGCDSIAVPRSETTPRIKIAMELPPGWHDGQLPVLRFQLDAERSRGWILTRDGVFIFDFKTRQTIAHVPLPDWQWLGERYSCPPDLALGPQGEALVSSNVLPALWRVDPVSFAVSRHELALDQDNDKDIGFSGLAYSAEHQKFYAVSSLHGSLWRIDPRLKTAHKIPLSEPVRKACALAIPPRVSHHSTSRLFSVCVGADPGSQRINLAPDQRHGYVTTRACAA